MSDSGSTFWKEPTQFPLNYPNEHTLKLHKFRPLLKMLFSNMVAELNMETLGETSYCSWWMVCGWSRTSLGKQHSLNGSWMDDISPIMKEYTRAQVCQIILSVGCLGLATNNFVTGFRVRVLPWWVAPDSYPWPLLLLRTLPNPVVQPPTRLLRLSKVDH